MSTAIPLGAASRNSFIISLLGEGANSYRVGSVQIVSDDMRNSYCFGAGRSIESVFIPEFSRSFLGTLNRQDLQDSPLDLPDFSMILPGVGMSGLRIKLVQEGGEARRVTLHFRRYVGDILRVLCFLPAAELSPARVRERIAVEVLRDIVTPVFDLMSLCHPSSRDAVKNHSDAIAARLDRLAAQQEEIKFYTGMLARYVAGCQQDATETLEQPANDIPSAQGVGGGRESRGG